MAWAVCQGDGEPAGTALLAMKAREDLKASQCLTTQSSRSSLPRPCGLLHHFDCLMSKSISSVSSPARASLYQVDHPGPSRCIVSTDRKNPSRPTLRICICVSSGNIGPSSRIRRALSLDILGQAQRQTRLDSVTRGSPSVF